MEKINNKSYNQLNYYPSETFKINLCTTNNIPHETKKLPAKCLRDAKKNVHCRRTSSQKLAKSKLGIFDRISDFQLHKNSHQSNIIKWYYCRKDRMSNTFCFQKLLIRNRRTSSSSIATLDEHSTFFSVTKFRLYNKMNLQILANLIYSSNIEKFLVNCKSFEISESKGNPIFYEKGLSCYGHTDYAILAIQVNFTDMYLRGRNLVKLLKSEFAWQKRKRQFGNSTINLFENLDAMVRIEHFMNYVLHKVNYLNEKRKRDILSLIFSTGSFIVSLDSRFQIDLIRKRHNNNEQKINELFHMIEHTSDIMEMFQGKINHIGEILGDNFNLYRLKFFESEALVYLNEIFKDLSNAMGNGKIPYSLIDTYKLSNYLNSFEKNLTMNKFVLFQSLEDIPHKDAT